MKQFKNNSSILRHLGKDYSLIQKLKLRGTGSSKVIYIKGIESFEKLAKSSESHSFSNFQLFPNGLVVRLSKNGKTEGIILQKDEIGSISIVARKINLRRSQHSIEKNELVHDAIISFKLQDGQSALFYSLTTHYKLVLLFFNKDWLKTKLHFSVDNAPPINDSDGFLGDIIRLLLLS